MGKAGSKKYLIVKARSRIRKVYVSDLKAVIMRPRPIHRPPVPPFYAVRGKAQDEDTDASSSGVEEECTSMVSLA